MVKTHEISGTVLFEEKQRFPKWLIFLLVGMLLLILTGMTMLAIFNQEEKSEALLALAIALPIQVVLMYVFLTSELELAVTSNGFYYKWKPLHRKFRVIEKELIETAVIRRLPMLNHGFGWVPLLGRFYNTHQGLGLHFYLRNGKRLFFSAKDPGQLHNAVRAMISEQKNRGA